VDWVADDAVCRCRGGNGCWHYLRAPAEPPADLCWCNFCTKVSRHDGTRAMPEGWSEVCASNGKMECFLRRHAASWNFYCSECLEKDDCACKNPHPGNCPKCEKGESPWDPDRKRELQVRFQKEQEVFANRRIVLVWGPHFYVATDIPTLKIRTFGGSFRLLGTHELAHVFAERAEKARREFVRALGDSVVASAPHGIYLPKRENTAEKIQAKYFGSPRTNLLYGGGQAGGRVADGVCGNGFCASLTKHGGDDEGLHHAVRHQIGHLLISNWVNGSPDKRNLPPWVFEGAAHWLAKRHPLLVDGVVWCASEGSAISGSGKGWDKDARKIAGDAKLDPIEKLLDKSITEELKFEDHVRAWSYFETALAEDREKFVAILAALRSNVPARQAWLENAQCAPEQWDQRWKDRLLGRRPSMGEFPGERDGDEGPGALERRALRTETDMITLAARIQGTGVCTDPLTAKVLVDLFARRSDRVRETLSVLLAKTTAPEVLAAIRERGLASPDSTVRAYAARVLGLAGDQGSLEALRLLAADKEWFCRAEAALALMRLRDPKLVDAVAPLLQDAAPKARIAALDAIGSAGPAGEKVLSKVLANLDSPNWQVRSATAQCLGGMGAMGAVEALIGRMTSEAGRIRVDTHAALKAITNDDLGMNPDHWAKWWKREREKAGGGLPARGTAPPPENPEDSRYALKERAYGMQVFEQRVGYVLDMSGSMHTFFTPDPESVKRLRRQYQGATKFDISKEEIVQSVAGLNPAARFTVIAFADNPRWMSRTLVPAGEDGKSKADSFLAGCRQPPSGGGRRKGSSPPMSNFYGAFQSILEVPTSGDPAPGFQDTADTVFFLTDGQPTKGEIIDADALLSWFNGHNRYARIRVHVVAYGNTGIDIPFLTHLAEDNGGKFIHIREAAHGSGEDLPGPVPK
jgi:HEAT repeat protein